MCGRFTLKTPLGKWLSELFGESLIDPVPEVEPRYNIAPTQPILIARRNSTTARIQLDLVRWGFVPLWAGEIRSGAPLINARAETLTEKPIFRAAIQRDRCVVIADGYYEWQSLNVKSKQPFWIHRSDESPFLMAALTATNRKIDPAHPLKSAAIVTCASNERLSSIHDRMPVILNSPEKIQRWLSCEQTVGELPDDDLSPVSDDYFQARPVSSWVGNPRHEDSRCIQSMPALWQRTSDNAEPVEPDT